MKRYLFELEIATRFVFLIGIFGFNMFYLNTNEYFLISFYILSTSILFLVEGLLKDYKMSLYIKIANILFSLLFLKTDIKITFLVVFILVVEETKNNLLGNSIGIILIIVGSTISKLNFSLFYFLYNSVLFLVIYRGLIYLVSRINTLEVLDAKARKKIVKNNDKIKENEIVKKQGIKLARLEERNELGRKMHDKIGHVIAGSMMRLEAVKIIVNMDKDKADEMLEEVIENLRNGMTDIRDIIHKTTPMKEEMGINKIKNVLVDKFNNTNIKLKFSIVGDISCISYELWNKIEEFVIELSTNTLKYSKADEIDFSIEVLNKFIRVQFKDNGIGAKNIKKGFGLTKIEEDLIELKGRLILDGQRGFNIAILFNR